MAEFLTTYGISYEIERIIMNARTHLTLVSPYLQISKTLLERLKDASNNNVSIKIIYGKDELKSNEREALARLKNLELFYFDNLHAKCYFNEDRMVITSMNMYEFSEKNNREMGVLIDRRQDRNLYEKAFSETKSILKSAEEIELPRHSTKSIVKLSTKKQNKLVVNTINHDSYCIRCSDRIEFNPEMPYCDHCYAVWAYYGNVQYEEKFCHNCGQKEITSKEKPQCYTCFCNWVSS